MLTQVSSSLSFLANPSLCLWIILFTAFEINSSLRKGSRSYCTYPRDSYLKSELSNFLNRIIILLISQRKKKTNLPDLRVDLHLFFLVQSLIIERLVGDVRVTSVSRIHEYSRLICKKLRATMVSKRVVPIHL